MSVKFCIYIKDDDLLQIVQSQKNKSDYVQRTIRFYEENKDIVKRLANVLIEGES